MGHLIGKPIDVDHSRNHVIGHYLDYKYIAENSRSVFLDKIHSIHTGKLTNTYSVLNAYDLNGCDQFNIKKYTNVKLLCNWTDSKSCCDEFNRMSINNDYTWGNMKIYDNSFLSKFDILLILHEQRKALNINKEGYSIVKKVKRNFEHYIEIF